MLDQRRAATRPEERREQLFTERYEGLLAWALRLTNQDHEAAEDLVQDAFVQFMLGRTGVEQIENIDGYLRGILRYMNLQPCPSIDERVTPAVASAELEVDVAYLLNQAKADRNEQVALTRSAGGSLRVEGIVESCTNWCWPTTTQ